MKKKDRENIIQMMKKNIQKDEEEDLNEENNEKQINKLNKLFKVLIIYIHISFFFN